MFPKNIKIKNLIPLFCNRENTLKLFNDDLIKPFLNRTVRNLSGGERKLAEVLIIIHSEAEFILLEQPYSGLSPILTEKLMKIIRERSQEEGFIISDFNIEEAIAISDEIYLLSNAYLKQMKDLNELQHHYYLPKSI